MNLLIHDKYTVVKELRSKMFGQHPGYFKAVFLKQTQIIIVSIYKYTRRVAAFMQKINCLHIISAKKNNFDMGRISLFQYD